MTFFNPKFGFVHSLTKIVL